METVKVTGQGTVTVTWDELATALCRVLAPLGVVPTDITDKQLEHLEGVIVAARKRLREKSGG